MKWYGLTEKPLMVRALTVRDAEAHGKCYERCENRTERIVGFHN